MPHRYQDTDLPEVLPNRWHVSCLLLNVSSTSPQRQPLKQAADGKLSMGLLLLLIQLLNDWWMEK